MNLGKALHAIGQYNPAKEALLKAVILNPDEEAANHTLGVLYDEEQNYEAASGYNDSDVISVKDYWLNLKNN